MNLNLSTNLNSATKLVSIRSPVEQPLDGQVHLIEGGLQILARQSSDPLRHLVSPLLQILCHVVDDLGSVVCRSLAPPIELTNEGNNVLYFPVAGRKPCGRSSKTWGETITEDRRASNFIHIDPTDKQAWRTAIKEMNRPIINNNICKNVLMVAILP